MAAPFELDLSGDAGAPAAARVHILTALADVLTGLPADSTLRDDLELVISELVTNAVRAGSSTIRVGVLHEAGRVQLRVEDEVTGWPEQRTAGIHDVNGRGLALVSALCSAWGVRLTGATGGKVVWAELDVPAAG